MQAHDNGEGALFGVAGDAGLERGVCAVAPHGVAVEPAHAVDEVAVAEEAAVVWAGDRGVVYPAAARVAHEVSVGPDAEVLVLPFAEEGGEIFDDLVGYTSLAAACSIGVGEKVLKKGYHLGLVYVLFVDGICLHSVDPGLRVVDCLPRNICPLIVLLNSLEEDMYVDQLRQGGKILMLILGCFSVACKSGSQLGECVLTPSRSAVAEHDATS